MPLREQRPATTGQGGGGGLPRNRAYRSAGQLEPALLYWSVRERRSPLKWSPGFLAGTGGAGPEESTGLPQAYSYED